jgi:hypothetical protein
MRWSRLGCGILLGRLLRILGAANRLRGTGAVAAPSETQGMPQHCACSAPSKSSERKSSRTTYWLQPTPTAAVMREKACLFKRADTKELNTDNVTRRAAKPGPACLPSACASLRARHSCPHVPVNQHHYIAPPSRASHDIGMNLRLPDEICILIYEQVDIKDRANCARINSCFFRLHLQDRYHFIRLRYSSTESQEKRTQWLLSRLRCEHRQLRQPPRLLTCGLTGQGSIHIVPRPPHRPGRCRQSRRYKTFT